MAGIVCGGTTPNGQGQWYVAGAVAANVPYQNLCGNTAPVAGPSPSQIGSATQTQVLYSGANPTSGVMAAGSGPTGIYPYIRCVSAGGLVNGQTVVDIVLPNGEKDVQSAFCVVYTIAGGLLT
jgi:hypothetical protein